MTKLIINLIGIGLTALLLACCSSHNSKAPVSNIFDETNLSEGEKMILAARNEYNFGRVSALCDSLEKTGDISPVAANFYHGGALIYSGKMGEAQQYLEKAIADSMPDAADMRLYLRAKSLLARILTTEGKFEQALSQALPTLAMMDSLGNKDFGDMTQLFIVIGECQQNLHMTKEAAASFAKAYALLRDWMASDSTGTDMPRAIIRLDNISASYISTSAYREAKTWLEREDSALAVYMTKPEIAVKQADMLRGSISLDLSEACEQLGLSEEAARHYAEHRKTHFSATNLARINACDYLMAAGRYAEAADNYSALNLMFEKRDYELSLDNIGQYLLPKMKANVLAGRKDSALATGMKIIECFDSALTSQKNDAAAELATVYDTQGKERQIAEQQLQMSRGRVAALVVSIIALTVFFVIFTIIRQRAAKRLARVTASKERMEGELSIARNIQMSMLPSTFPQREGLDMFASMTPAKEVGGDLYGFQMEGERLYFALGDVSGKGVPASLFMAQATRLFLTLAKQGLMPAEICTRMNDALSGEDNESGMFVTFFLGLVDLQTGHLDFCNAGHNPPVIGGGDHQGVFLEMLPNAPIGLFPGLEYEGEQIDSIKGRPLFIYTDGLNEAENAQQEQLGDDRLLSILRTIPFHSAQQVIETLKAEVEAHRNGAEPNDDLTMMCLRVN
jgi:serine phosphatase RsbU (regulator of sigma subunit)